MFINPAVLIDQTIDSLQLIAELLRDDLNELTRPASSSDIFRCRAAVRTIDALLPQLTDAKEMLGPTSAISELEGMPAQRICANCDDF